MSTTIDKIKGGANTVLEQGKTALSDKKVLVPLLAALAGGLTTGTLTGLESPRDGEAKSSRRLRILRNAALGAGAAGGAAALIPKGYEELSTMRPAGEVDPVAKALRHPAVMAGTGGGALAVLNKGRGADVGKAQEALTNILHRSTTNPNSPLRVALQGLPDGMNSRDIHGHLLQLMENPGTRTEIETALSGASGGNRSAVLNALREAHLPTTGMAGPSWVSKALHAAGDATHGLVGGSARPIIGTGAAVMGSQRAKLIAAILAGVSAPLAVSGAANHFSGGDK